MGTTTAPSVDIPSDNDLSLPASLAESAGPIAETEEVPVKPGTSAQSAAHRSGGLGGRLWRPAPDNLSLMHKVAKALVCGALLCAIAFLWLTVRQQQIQLTTLDAAFRSGQLHTLPDRMQEIENRLQRYVLKSQVDKWQQSLDGQELSLITFRQQLSRMSVDVKEARSVAEQAVAGQKATGVRFDVLHKALEAQIARIDTLTTWKEEWNKRAVTPTAKTAPVPGGSPVTAKKPSKPRSLQPPFTLVSTERRGGQAYAVVLPAGDGSWARLRLLSPGESCSGWTLLNISGNQAEFQVNGQVQRLTL